MRSTLVLSALVAQAFAVRPFLNEADTGFEAFLPNNGSLPPLSDIKGLPDFDAAARQFMNISSYTYYRNGAGGEWSYRNNLEVYGRIRFRPRVMVDVLNVGNTLSTSILGHNFSVPFFITPVARGGFANPEGELDILRAAEAENVAYIPSMYSSFPMEEIVAAKNDSEFPTYQQLYVDNTNDTAAEAQIRRIEKTGAKAIFLTVDSAANGVRQRAERYGQGSADTELTLLTWERYAILQNLTELPIIPKGIQTVEDARAAVAAGVKAIYLSNHGGRQVDHAPSAFEVALEIHAEAPEIFTQVEVYADGGVRYGSDVLKLLALGVRAVGVGRPIYYANCYGTEGVTKAIQLLKTEILNDAGNLGVPDVQQIDDSSLALKYITYNGWGT